MFGCCCCCCCCCCCDCSAFDLRRGPYGVLGVVAFPRGPQPKHHDHGRRRRRRRRRVKNKTKKKSKALKKNAPKSARTSSRRRPNSPMPGQSSSELGLEFSGSDHYCPRMELHYSRSSPEKSWRRMQTRRCR